MHDAATKSAVDAPGLEEVIDQIDPDDAALIRLWHWMSEHCVVDSRREEFWRLAHTMEATNRRRRQEAYAQGVADTAPTRRRAADVMSETVAGYTAGFQEGRREAILAVLGNIGAPAVRFDDSCTPDPS